MISDASDEILNTDNATVVKAAAEAGTLTFDDDATLTVEQLWFLPSGPVATCPPFGGRRYFDHRGYWRRHL